MNVRLTDNGKSVDVSRFKKLATLKFSSGNSFSDTVLVISRDDRGYILFTFNPVVGDLSLSPDAARALGEAIIQCGKNKL